MVYQFSFINKVLLILLMVLVLFQWLVPVKAAWKTLIPIVRWTMISCAAIHLLRLLFTMPQLPWPGRIHGLYDWAYLLMIVSNTLLPFILWFKKPGNNIYFLLLIAIMMNIGWIFEWIIIGMYYFLS